MSEDIQPAAPAPVSVKHDKRHDPHPTPNDAASTAARKQRREEQIRALGTIGAIIPPGTPGKVLEILMASAFLTGREIAQEFGCSYSRVKQILNSYEPIRHQIIENRDKLISGLYSSISYLAGNRLRQGLLSKACRVDTIRDLQAVANTAATASHIAIAHDRQSQPDRPSPEQAQEIRIRRAKAVKALSEPMTGKVMPLTDKATPHE